MKNNNFDVIVIWSGSGWLTVSIWLAAAWKKVALVEKGLIWWDCTNYWCVPSKAFIDIAKSWKYDNISDALIEVRERRKEIQDEETVEKIEKYGMKIFKWLASFKDKNTVLIDGKKEISATNIVISIWSKPIIYPIDWLDNKDILTNENVFELTENIKNLVVIGWWYIWCELAESFISIWVKVTIIQRNIRLIPREEKESSEVIEKIFEEKWINIMTSTTVEKAENWKLIVFDKSTDIKKEIKYDKVLVALWRWTNVEKLELEKVWIKYDKKWIIVDKYNRTGIKNIFAIWDCVKNNPQFTHLANNEWRWVIRNILVPFLKSSVRNAILPATLYTNIEVARVWQTEEELLRHYNEEDIVYKIIYFENNDRSKLTHDKIWFVKINFRRVTWKILWATIVWKWAWEILPVLTSSMENKISAYKLSKLIFAYPTKAEIIKKVADQFVVWTISNIKNEIKYYLKNNILQIITWIIWIILIYSFFTYKSIYDLSIEQIALNIYNFISLNPTVGPLIYIFLYAIRPVVLFPATFMTFMSWALFGFWWWLAFTLIWENMSASFAYLLGRIFWKKIIKPWVNNGIIDDIRNKANETPFITILMTRLLFFPFDLVNYISWFLKINYKWFFLATLIWIIPGASVFILAWAAFHTEKIESFSDAIKNIDVSMLLFAWILFIITILFAKILKKLKK